MNDMTCARCQDTVSPQLIDFVGSDPVCRKCIIADASDPIAIARGERALLRSMGRRQLSVGVLTLAIGIAVLALGAGGGGSLMLIPTGLLLGGFYEIARGINNLSA